MSDTYKSPNRFALEAALVRAGVETVEVDGTLRPSPKYTHAHGLRITASMLKEYAAKPFAILRYVGNDSHVESAHADADDAARTLASMLGMH